MASLTPTFAHLWHDLPTELQLEIISHNLTYSTEIHHSLVTHTRLYGTSSYTQHVTLLTTLHRHLVMGNSIALSARQTFYSSNVFVMGATTYGCRMRAAVPPPAMRPLI